MGRRARTHAPPAADGPLAALEHALVVFDPFPKLVGSSEGHARAPSSPFGLRAAMADEHVAAVQHGFARGHFDLVRRVAEQEAVTMHDHATSRRRAT